MKPEVLLSGLGIPESPRWHDGRLWFCNWIVQEIVAVGLDGKAEVVAAGPTSMGHSIDWLPDGRMLVTGRELSRQEPDGTMVTHAGPAGGNEIVVDGRGNIYVNGADFDFAGGETPKPGYIKLVTPTGEVREVAGDIQFPNGMVVTPDNRTLVIAESFAGRLTAFDIAADGGLLNRRVWADGIGPDGICLDAEGAIWTSPGMGANACVRVAEGGRILDRIELPDGHTPFALMLGGPDRQILFVLTADWRATDSIGDNLQRLVTGPRTGKVLTVPAPAPGAGRP
ncbi:SMP-30/gluconolactonase/LRE family protein [Flindersiella endophytica]